MNKRLLYISNTRLPTEKAHGYQICKMCEALAQNGMEVLLLHPQRRQSDPFLKSESIFDYYDVRPLFEIRTVQNLDVVPLEGFLSRQAFSVVFFAHALVWGLYATLIARREGGDLFYTRDSAVAYWLVRFGLPTVFEAHVVPKGGQTWLLRGIRRKKTLQSVVALTSFIRERFIRMGFPPAQVLVLADGVDLSLFEALPSKEECRDRLGLPPDRPIIGYTGRFRTLEKEKGIPELIEAMAYLTSVNGSEPLLLCVGGPMEAVPAYLDSARRLEVPERQIQFVDRVRNREVPSWMRSCDVVTIPWPWSEFSAYFTSPLKLFEYMAAGVPIVASNLPSIREVLRHGENAWLVEPGSPKALGDGIHKVLADDLLGSRLAQQARLDVGQYTWIQRADTILKHLNQKPST